MFLQQFFDVLGLSYRDASDLWLEDPLARTQERAARLKKRLQRACQSLVRRRRVIEILRQNVDRNGLHVQETRYRLLLERVTRARRKLFRLQNKMQALKVARVLSGQRN